MIQETRAQHLLDIVDKIGLTNEELVALGPAA